jgi:hypothetical protein
LDKYESYVNCTGIAKHVYTAELHLATFVSVPADSSDLAFDVSIRQIDDRIHYITRSSLISGDLARLNHPSGENSSYNLEFWGTTLDCVTKDRSIEKLVSQSDVVSGEERFEVSPNFWQVPKLLVSELRSKNDPYFWFANTTITYRTTQFEDAYRYYPCLTDRDRKLKLADDKSSGYLSVPEAGLYFFIPTKETICHPKLMRYNVEIAHKGGSQEISYSITDPGSIPAYTSIFNDFKGSFDLFVRLSDAVALYTDFAKNLNSSFTSYKSGYFRYPEDPESRQPYTLENGTVVETCMLEEVQNIGYPDHGPRSDVWPLSVFERRLYSKYNYDPKFDPKIAAALLVNTTISALSMNERYEVVNGTITRNFNIYRFEHKLVFFLPYGLSLGLAIPVIALGLIALYIQNNGVSAISGGFVQLLMTTTGHTAIDSVMAKGSATLGGHENVSNELRNMEIKFGELVENDQDGRTRTAMARSLSDRFNDSTVCQEETHNMVDDLIDPETVRSAHRAAFGTAQDIRPLRRRVMASKA